MTTTPAGPSYDRRSVQHGMPVVSAAGERIGTVDVTGRTYVHLDAKRKKGGALIPWTAVRGIERGRLVVEGGAEVLLAPDAATGEDGPLMYTRPVPLTAH